MLQNIAARIAGSLSLKEGQVQNTLQLFAEGATIPFIARYRKERTGSLDELQIQQIQEKADYFEKLHQRKEHILKAINEQGLLDDELKHKIENTWDLNELEDLYLPFKPKRKTKASIARDLGLEPLAGSLMKQDHRDPEALAASFVKGKLTSVEDALSGARAIMAEWMNERLSARKSLRNFYARKAIIQSKLKKAKAEDAAQYRDYFDFQEPLNRIPSHRLLAIRRGEQEGFLRVKIAPEESEALAILERIFVKGNTAASEQVYLALKDSYKRLMQPSLETEFAAESKQRADESAIKVFAENLKQLLLSPPLGQKRILAIDPGYRTGCKVVCLDEQGRLLHNDTIYPHPPQRETGKAAAKIAHLAEAYKIEALAIGNGTAGRETEEFVSKKVRFKYPVQAFVVSEAGASVYSVSSVARAEFPNYDVTVRGAVSIGRRLMDPLAELVKIDPKSIGVGQYQHDVDQNALKAALGRVVEQVVNAVGVNLNTSSKHLLEYISGLGPKLAENIVNYREEHGPFKSRQDLLKVPKLGPKAFEQAAGFLRISEAENPLDNSGVHPESYPVVEKMAKDLKHSVRDLIGKGDLLSQLDLSNYTQKDLGLPTLKDIIQELAKHGRDPRGAAKVFQFDARVRSISDLQEGMILPGIVSNITNFGAFVDVGAKQDGLVHISELANKFVRDPNEVVHLQQQVKVKVISVDIPRKRIQFSMKQV
jgi:uncharacterized protein